MSLPLVFEFCLLYYDDLSRPTANLTIKARVREEEYKSKLTN